jgi:hypothetical protein
MQWKPRKSFDNNILCFSLVMSLCRHVPVEYLGNFPQNPLSEQWALLKGFTHTVMSTGVAILESSGGFNMNDPPGLGISSNPSLCVSLLELTLRCSIFAPGLLIDLPCFPSTLMMVASSASYNHRNCCSMSLQIISRMFQSPTLAAIIQPHTQTLLNIVCSTLPKLAPIEVLRIAGSAISGILKSPHGIAVDVLLSAALTQPVYTPVSLALKQRFVATVHVNMGNEAKFCSFVKDFAMVHYPFPSGPLVSTNTPHNDISLPLQVCRSLQSEDCLVAYETATPPRVASSHVHPSRRHLVGL